MKLTESDLIQELFKSVEVLGVDATTNVLRIARDNSLSLQDKRVDFVLKMVSEYFLHPIENIINSHSKSRMRILALKFSVFYLYEDFKFSFTNLKILLKRDKSFLSRCCKDIRENINDKTINKAKIKFDLLIADFKLKNKL